MVKVGWTKCTHCGKEMRTSAKIGNRILCRSENCGRSFKVKVKLPYPANRTEHGFEVKSADKLPRELRINGSKKIINS